MLQDYRIPSAPPFAGYGFRYTSASTLKKALDQRCELNRQSAKTLKSNVIRGNERRILHIPPPQLLYLHEYYPSWFLLSTTFPNFFKNFFKNPTYPTHNNSILQFMPKVPNFQAKRSPALTRLVRGLILNPLCLFSSTPPANARPLSCEFMPKVVPHQKVWCAGQSQPSLCGLTKSAPAKQKKFEPSSLSEKVFRFDRQSFFQKTAKPILFILSKILLFSLHFAPSPPK